jgi:hypothetical protein
MGEGSRHGVEERVQHRVRKPEGSGQISLAVCLLVCNPQEQTLELGLPADSPKAALQMRLGGIC